MGACWCMYTQTLTAKVLHFKTELRIEAGRENGKKTKEPVCSISKASTQLLNSCTSGFIAQSNNKVDHFFPSSLLCSGFWPANWTMITYLEPNNFFQTRHSTQSWIQFLNQIRSTQILATVRIWCRSVHTGPLCWAVGQVAVATMAIMSTLLRWGFFVARQKESGCQKLFTLRQSKRHLTQFPLRGPFVAKIFCDL